LDAGKGQNSEPKHSIIGTKPVTGFLTWFLPASALETPSRRLVVVIALLLIISLLHQLQLMCTSLLRTYTGERLVLGFRAKLFQQAQRWSVAYHDSKVQRIQPFAFNGMPPHIRYLTLKLPSHS